MKKILFIYVPKIAEEKKFGDEIIKEYVGSKE